MNVLLKFLFSLIAHAAWRRIGGGGAVPPIKLPRTGRSIPIPVLSSWQLMVVMWVAKKIWQQHGGSVKTRLVNADNPVVRRVGSYVPDMAGAAATTDAQNVTIKTTQQPASNGASSSAPSSIKAPTVSTKAHSHDTQRLDNDDDTSLLSSLQNGTSSAPTA